jgi:translation initiation factor 2 beta subunit (eIF-2beta)/eIF-5
VKASSRLPKHKQTPRNPMKAKIPTPRKKVTVYTRCTRCDSFREKLRVKNGYWRFKHEYCLHCGGVLEITTVLQ